MDPRYSFYIWGSFGIVAVALVWNVLSPWLARRAIKQRLAEADEVEKEVNT